MKFDVVMKFLAVILGFALWTYLGMMGKTDLNALVDLLKVGLGALVYHMISDMGGAAPAAPAALPDVAPPTKPTLFVPGRPEGVPINQQGSALLWFLGVIAFIAVGCIIGAIEGCAAIPQPVVDQVRTSGENQVTNLKLLVCNLPIFSVVSHPEMYDAVKSWCMPPAGSPAPQTLLPASKP